jgi:alkaline phosphatase D
MMGPAQEAWLGGELAGSVKAGHAWQVVGSGVVMGRLLMPRIGHELSAAEVAALGEQARKRIERWQPIAQLGLPYGLDMWDGYPIDRERVYDLVKQAGARPIVVSGDSHAFWANDLADAGGRRVAVEFAGTSVTSPGADDGLKMKIGPAFAAASPEVVFSDQGAKGFILLTLSHTEARGDLMAVSSITSKTFTTRMVKSFRVTPEGTGLSGLREA